MRTTVRALAFILATMLSSTLLAQVDDGFDAFLEEANADFDAFLEEEEKAFSDFLRDPWKEFESERPDELPPRPEPPVPEHYDAKAHPADEQPATIVIGEIFKLNRVSDGGNPTIKVVDVDKIDFGTAPRRKQGGSKTVVRDTMVIAFDTTPRPMPTAPMPKQCLSARCPTNNATQPDNFPPPATRQTLGGIHAYISSSTPGSHALPRDTPCRFLLFLPARPPESFSVHPQE